MIVNLAVRVLQLLFGAVVLALSAVLIHNYGPGHGPSLIDYGAFCGGAGVLIAAVGVVASFIEPLQGIIMLALDGLAAFFLLAGGIAYAATIKVGSCTDVSDGGYLTRNQKTFCPNTDQYKYAGSKGEKLFLSDTESRCREVQATTAFLWFLWASFAVTLVLSFLGRGKGR